MDTRLTRLIAKRDFLEDQLDSGKDYIEMDVSSGNRVKRSDAIDRLTKVIYPQIEKLERIANARRGPATNRARLYRA